MTRFEVNSYSDAELEAEFKELFPLGFAGADVLEELAPAGWENSPLVATFHPSLTQVYEETVRVHTNIESLRRRDDKRPVRPPPMFEEVAKDFREHPIKPETE